jgi:hypothetical protein
MLVNPELLKNNYLLQTIIIVGHYYLWTKKF